MLRIETTRDDGGTVLRLIGRIDAQHVAEVAAHMPGDQRVTLDLAEVTLVDMDAVHFLLDCEAHGIALRDCLPYIRTWMDRERTSHDH